MWGIPIPKHVIPFCLCSNKKTFNSFKLSRKSVLLTLVQFAMGPLFSIVINFGGIALLGLGIHSSLVAVHELGLEKYCNLILFHHCKPCFKCFLPFFLADIWWRSSGMEGTSPSHSSSSDEKNAERDSSGHIFNRGDKISSQYGQSKPDADKLLLCDSISNESASIGSSNPENCSDTSSLSSENSVSASFLRDYGNMIYLINLLPSRAQRGLSNFPLKLNCADATAEHIVIGCNIDTLFLYNRRSYSLQRLKCSVWLSSLFFYILYIFFHSFHLWISIFQNLDFENITSIKMIASIELMVAAGSSCGALVIFKVPILTNTEVCFNFNPYALP